MWQGGNANEEGVIGKLEFKCPPKTPVRSMTAGEVAFCGEYPEDDNGFSISCIIIKVSSSQYKMPVNSNCFYIRYLCCGQFKFGENELVKQGDLLCTTGQENGQVTDKLCIDFCTELPAVAWGNTQEIDSTKIQYNAYQIWKKQAPNKEGRCWEVFGTPAKYETISLKTAAKGGGYVKTDNIVGATGTYDNGKFIFNLYKQGTSGGGYWAYLPYSEGNYGTSACGATAVAIILSGYIENIDPYIFGEENQKMGSPTYIATLENTVKNIFGFDYGTVSSDEEAQKILMEQGYGFVYNEISTRPGISGHYISILDYDKNTNKYFVGQPNASEHGWFSMEEIKNAKGDGSWAFYIKR